MCRAGHPRYDVDMTSTPAPHRTRARRISTAVASAAAVLGAAAPAAHAAVDAPDVPGEIAVDGPHTPYLRTHAEGVQIYRCDLIAGTYQWSFVAPSATLFARNDKVLGTHFGGPTWQARDGSAVRARREDGVTVDPSAIPWLLLEVTAAQAGADGDRLVHTTWIQRIDTVGGLAPAAEACHAATASTLAEVPYEADYVFWKRTGG
jgi:hypothetical protein